MKRRSNLVLAGALIATGATGASAQDLLSVEELKGCLRAQQSLAEQRTDIERRSEALDRARSTLDEVEQDIAERRALLDSTDALLRDRYRSLLMEEERMTDIYQDELEAHNEHVVAYNEARDEYMQTCADRTYNDAIMARAKQELGME